MNKLNYRCIYSCKIYGENTSNIKIQELYLPWFHGYEKKNKKQPCCCTAQGTKAGKTVVAASCVFVMKHCQC